MARKDLLKGLLPTGEAPVERPNVERPVGAAPGRGAIGAVSRSIADLKDRALVDVPADLVDMAGIPDRLDEDAEGIAALAESIRQYGQQVPVMLRQSPNHEGRYDVIYGRRRVAALKQLGKPVRAMIRNLDDRDLILAQGQENAARKELSFIEKSLFARSMEAQGFDRKTICDALHIDKTVVSRMLQVAEAVPAKLIHAIGTAPAAGRDRWMALARRVRGRGVAELVKAAQGPDSDARFQAVVAAAGQPSPAPQTAPVTGAEGAALGQVKRGRKAVSIEISQENAAFADWLLDRMHELHRDWHATRAKD